MDGAVSDDGISEAEINLTIALKLQNLLEQSGATVIFVSIHLNKIPQEQYSGWQTFFKKDNEQGEKLATAIQESLKEAVGKENNRLPMKLDNVYIVKNVEIPLTIVECGFLSNEEEEKKLQEDEYQNRLAWGIYNGINDYFYEL